MDGRGRSVDRSEESLNSEEATLTTTNSTVPSRFLPRVFLLFSNITAAALTRLLLLSNKNTLHFGHKVHVHGGMLVRWEFLMK